MGFLLCGILFKNRCRKCHVVQQWNSSGWSDHLHRLGCHFKAGRQYVCGRCSGWVRDEHLQGCDAGRGAMENWFVNTESPVMKNSLLWPIEFDVHYPGSANAPILPSFDQCLCGVGSLFMVFFWKLKDRTQKNDFNSIVLEYWPCDFLTRSKTVFLGNRFDL